MVDVGRVRSMTGSVFHKQEILLEVLSKGTCWSKMSKFIAAEDLVEDEANETKL